MNNQYGLFHPSRFAGSDHPTVSAIVPWVCFVATLALLILFRPVSIFAAFTARCVATDQFWYPSAGGAWPLVASFFLVFFLLFIWSLVIAVDGWRHSKGTRVMIIINILATSICLYTFKPLHQNANFQYQERHGFFAAITTPLIILFSDRKEPACATYQRFSGRWRVIDRDIGNYGFDIPARWIDLYPWGKVRAAPEDGQRPDQGHWYAPYQSRYSEDDLWRDGDIWTERFGATWDFQIRGDQLILTSPEDFRELEGSKITLERIEQPPSSTWE